MMTMTEAHQRTALNRFTLRQIGPQFVIHPVEGNKSAGFQDYFSDDLEDVVLMSGRLRRKLHK
jgi:hypothetical protein